MGRGVQNRGILTRNAVKTLLDLTVHPQVIFVAGLGHSGTTFLQLLLARSEELVGLGEIGIYIKRLREGKKEHPKCSCGQSANECEFWGQLSDLASSFDPFKEVLHRASEKFPDQILIDSTKSYNAFNEFYQGLPLEKVKVVFIVRDFRSWVLSRIRSNKSKGRKNKGVIVEAYRWYFLNKRMEKVVRNSGFDVMYVTYENLVFSNKTETERLLQFAGAKHVDQLPVLHRTVHDIYGNRMKDDPTVLAQIRYDSTWLSKFWPVILAPLLLPQYLYMKRLSARSKQ